MCLLPKDDSKACFEETLTTFSASLKAKKGKRAPCFCQMTFKGMIKMSHPHVRLFEHLKALHFKMEALRTEPLMCHRPNVSACDLKGTVSSRR